MLPQPSALAIETRADESALVAPGVETHATILHRRLLAMNGESLDSRQATDDELRATLFIQQNIQSRRSALDGLSNRGNQLDVLYAFSDPDWKVREHAAVLTALAVRTPREAHDGNADPQEMRFPLRVLLGFFESPVVPERDPRIAVKTAGDRGRQSGAVARIRARHAVLRVFQELHETFGTEPLFEEIRAYAKRQTTLLQCAPFTRSDSLALTGEPPAHPFSIYKAPFVTIVRNAALYYDCVDRLVEHVMKKHGTVETAQAQIMQREESSFCPVLREIRGIAGEDKELRRALCLPRMLRGIGGDCEFE